MLSPAKVMLADDQTMFREGLAELLNSRGDMDVVGQTNIGPVCVALAQKIKPDVVILQVESAIEKAKEILSELLRISPQPMVIIVTIFVDLRAVKELMDLGASACLLKSSSAEQLHRRDPYRRPRLQREEHDRGPAQAGARVGRGGIGRGALRPAVGGSCPCGPWLQ